MKRVLIIGGGASGLVAAIKAKTKDNEVIIIEKNNKCGKKLLLTGNGRCNFWNDNQTILKYQSEDRDIFEEAWQLKKEEVLGFFESIGIISKNINGYYYPYSNQAVSIVNALVNEAKRLGVKIKLEEEVLRIEKDKQFKVVTNKEEYSASFVVVATGGIAAPKTGSDGAGFRMVEKLGHTINKLLPSLVQLVGCDNFYKEWAGVRSDAIATLYEDGKKVSEEVGEVQFTDYGLSGICIFNLSGRVAKGLDLLKQEEIYLNLVPWFKGSKDEFLRFLEVQNKMLKTASLKEIMEGFLNYKLVNLILKLAKINEDTKWNKAPKELIGELLTNFRVEIKGTKDFSDAQVSQGGVSLKEIDSKTMESKLVKGLYLTGEILDVTGLCGGYNLGIAWITGMLAGDAISKK